MGKADAQVTFFALQMWEVVWLQYKVIFDGKTSTWTSQEETPYIIPDEYVIVILTWNNSLGYTWSLYKETEALYSVVHSFVPNCWSVVADKASDRYGSLRVCSVLPRATDDEDAQREVRVRDNLFARRSISSFLIRIVEKSAAGGRLYGHHHPTSPYSLVLHSLASQHMAVLLLLPIWGVFQMAVPCRAKSLWQ